MWGFVHFPDSNDYCVLKSSQVHEGNFAVGHTVTVLYKANVLYVNPSKALCDKECEKVLKRKDCRKRLSTDSNDSLKFTADLQCEKPPLTMFPCPGQPRCSSSEIDSVLFSIDQLSDYLHSRMDSIQDELLQLDAQSSMANLKLEKVEKSVTLVKSSMNEMLSRLPAQEAPQVLSYPYRLSKERTDDIQKSATSVTHFARVAERVLFANEKDKHLKLADRASQDKVRWLREMISYRFPSQTAGAEATTWAACVSAINSYHRRRRGISPIRPLPSCNREKPERIFYPPKEAGKLGAAAVSSDPRSNSPLDLVCGSPPVDTEMYDISCCSD